MTTGCFGRLLVSAPVLVLLVPIVACDQPSTKPTLSPSPLTTPIPGAGPPFTLSGTVYEATSSGARPLGGVPLDVSLEHQEREPRVTSDSDGRYSVLVASRESHKVAAVMPGFSQPCRASIALTRDGMLDIYLVASALLERTGVPASLPIVEPTLTGRVFEPTAAGRKPVSGANVYIDFSGGFGIAASARTVTDSTGRYFLCNVRDAGWGLTVNAWKYPLYSQSVTVPTPTTSEIDLELAER
jgi:hypothetical protein